MYATNPTKEIYLKPPVKESTDIPKSISNPMAWASSDLWETVSKRSYFFRDTETGDLEGNDRDRMQINRKSSRKELLSRMWILIVVAILYLAIIGALVIVLIFAPRHSSPYNFLSQPTLSLSENRVKGNLSLISSGHDKIEILQPVQPIPKKPFKSSQFDPLTHMYNGMQPRSDSTNPEDIKASTSKETGNKAKAATKEPAVTHRYRINNKIYDVSQFNTSWPWENA